MATVTIKVETEGRSTGERTVVEVSRGHQHHGTALIRAIHGLAKATKDDQLLTLATRVDQLVQLEFGWPAAEKEAQP